MRMKLIGKKDSNFKFKTTKQRVEGVSFYSKKINYYIFIHSEQKEKTRIPHWMFKISFTRYSRYKYSNNFKLNVIFGSGFTKSHSTKKDRKYRETQSFTFIKAMIRSNFANFECLFNIEISIFNSSADISL